MCSALCSMTGEFVVAGNDIAYVVAALIMAIGHEDDRDAIEHYGVLLDRALMSLPEPMDPALRKQNLERIERIRAKKGI